jgi:hypothetical protein
VTLETLPTKKVTPSGTEMYYENGVLSRVDGPAVIHIGGDEEWWLNGNLHRFDGVDTLHPAICRWATMQFEYWFNGTLICKNPDHDTIITEWQGWVDVGGGCVEPMVFMILRPEPKYKSLYPCKVEYDKKKVKSASAMKYYGTRLTHRLGDEESGT